MWRPGWTGAAVHLPSRNFKEWFPVFKEHLNHFPEVAMKLIQGFTLGMGPWEFGDVPDLETGIRTPFNDGGKTAHDRLFMGPGPEGKPLR
jgi:hypothetical protein